jgi:hypothetical protein
MDNDIEFFIKKFNVSRETIEKLDIYNHFLLENNGNNNERYGIWANGILSETPSKNFFMSVSKN